MKKWETILTVGKNLDRALVYVFVITLVMYCVGWLSDTEALWVSTSGWVAFGAFIYSIVWFISLFIIVMPKVKKERLS